MYQLTDLEKEKVMAFNADEAMTEAVRKVLLSSLYANGTLREGVKSDPLLNAALTDSFAVLRGQRNLSNEELGRNLMALTAGLNALEHGFNALKTIKKEVVAIEYNTNEAI